MNYTSPTKPTTHMASTLTPQQENLPNQQHHTTSDHNHDIADSMVQNRTATPSSLMSSTTIDNTPPSPSPPKEPTAVPSHDPSPEFWDVPQVCAWLESVGLENAVDSFVGKYHQPHSPFNLLITFLTLLEQEITGDVLLDLNMDTLKELGISAYGRRYKIMAAISKLRAATNTTQDQSKPEDDVNQVSAAILLLPIDPSLLTFDIIT
jgi:hypothetical protein